MPTTWPPRPAVSTGVAESKPAAIRIVRPSGRRPTEVGVSAELGAPVQRQRPDRVETHPKQPGNWHVANGVLIGSGPALSHLYTERGDFTDFHLRVEARFNQGGSSGVYLRCPLAQDFPRRKTRNARRIQATINNARIVRDITGGIQLSGRRK